MSKSTPVKRDLSQVLAAMRRIEDFTKKITKHDVYGSWTGPKDFMSPKSIDHVTGANKTKMIDICKLLQPLYLLNFLIRHTLKPPENVYDLEFPNNAEWRVIERFYKSFLARQEFQTDPKTKQTVDEMKKILQEPHKEERLWECCCENIKKMVRFFLYHINNDYGRRSRPGMAFLRTLSISADVDEAVKNFAAQAMKDLLALEYLQLDISNTDRLVNTSPVILNPKFIIVPSDKPIPVERSPRQSRSIRGMKRGGLRAFCTPFSRSPSPAARTDSKDTLCEMRRLLLLREAEYSSEFV